MGRCWRFGGVVLAVSACAGSALAASPHLELSWTGPPSCAEKAPVEAEVERLLARAPAGGPTLHVDARVEPRGPDRYHLVLETSEGENRFRRELDAASCEELTKPAALVIALAIDPEATARVLAETVPESKDVPAPVDAPPQPVARPEVSPAPPPAVAPDQGVARPPPANPRVWSPYVRPAVVFDSSVLPAPSTGPGVGIGIASSAWRFELGAFYLPARFAEVGPSITKGGDISLTAGTLSSCFVPIREPLELGPCLGMEAGVLHGEGVGVSAPAEDDVPWLAARAGGRVAFAFGRNFAASLRADALARVGRGEFVVENLGRVHSPGSFGLRLEAGLELGLP